MIKKVPLLLGLLLFAAFIPRLLQVHQVPPELFGDEIDVGYQAYSLFKTGRDLYRQLFPAYIHSLSEWRAPLLMYATVPTIAVFGLTETGVRLPQVMFGSLAPLLLFLLVYRQTRSWSAGFLSGVALAWMPWHFHYSRVAFEVVILLDLLLAGTALFLRRKYTLSVIMFSLSFYTYSTAVVFTPLLLFSLILLTRSFPGWKSLLLGFLLMFPFGFYLFSGRAGARFGLVSIFANTEILDSINLRRSESAGSMEPVFHNRPESFFRLFLDNYLRSFSTDFLFVRGDPNVRHSPQYTGHLLPVTAPWLLFGAYYLVRRRQWLWPIWLFLGPIPAALTIDGAFHATRLFVQTAPWAVLLGSGFLQIWQIVGRRFRPAVAGLVAILFIGQLAAFWHYYFLHYPRASWRWWHTGYKTVFTEIGRLASGYDRVFINNTYEPALIRFLWYTRYSPSAFHREFTVDQENPEIAPGFTGFTLADKYYFGSFTDRVKSAGLQNFLTPGSLYVLSQRDDLPGNWDWRTSPPEGIRILSSSASPFNDPILYLVAKE